MKITVAWKQLGLGVALAVFESVMMTTRGSHGDRESYAPWIFVICLAIFLWPLVRDLAKLLLWCPEPQRPLPRTVGRPARSRRIESSSAHSGSSLLQRPSGVRA
jgi:hypothetical protein